MVSVLRTLQAEWNSLVPAAQAAGIRRVRTLNLPLETIAYRREKLEWLRAQLAQAMSTTVAFTPHDLSVLTFGVELEFILPRGISHTDMATKLARLTGIPCTYLSYTHGGIHAWKIVTDASLGREVGAELVSPVLRGDEGFRQVRAMCKVLEEAGCKVDKKCGLHVHIGARDWGVDTFRNLVSLYQSAEEAIDAFMAPSRRASANNFCKKLEVNRLALESARSVDDVARSFGQTPGSGSVRSPGRYCKLNLQSFWQHGTVEFRHHAGTVDANKVINWTKLCLRLALAAVEGTRMAQSFDALMDAAKVPVEEKSYFEQRRAFFAQRLGAAATARSASGGSTASASPRRLTGLERTMREAIERGGAAGGAMTFRDIVEREANPFEANYDRADRADNPFESAGFDLQRRAVTPGQE